MNLVAELLNSSEFLIEIATRVLFVYLRELLITTGPQLHEETFKGD